MTAMQITSTAIIWPAKSSSGCDANSLRSSFTRCDSPDTAELWSTTLLSVRRPVPSSKAINIPKWNTWITASVSFFIVSDTHHADRYYLRLWYNMKVRRLRQTVLLYQSIPKSFNPSIDHLKSESSAEVSIGLIWRSIASSHIKK